jgi:predicted Zn-dependent protease
MEVKVKKYFKVHPDRSGEAGLGFMEVITGILVVVILGSVILHLARLGFSMYRLNASTKSIAEKLELARDLAKSKNQQTRVIFNAEDGIYGLDRNSNRKLDSAEVEELPEGVTLAEDATVVFTAAGSLDKSSKEPQIVISNSRDSRSVSISSMGSVEID